MTTQPLTVEVDADIGSVDAIVMRPRGATAVYVLAHGAGADMHHHFMVAIAERLYTRGVATLRFQFPFTQAGSRRPDRAPKLVATIAAAFEAAGRATRGLPRFCGGKSMGGRMSSHFVAQQSPDTAGLVFLGFPLHPPGKEGIARAAHLPEAKVPMLFVQGTRDKLAEIERMRGVVAGLGPRATLHVIEQADHGFAVPKRTGRTADDVLDEMADTVAAFASRHGRS